MAYVSESPGDISRHAGYWAPLRNLNLSSRGVVELPHSERVPPGDAEAGSGLKSTGLALSFSEQSEVLPTRSGLKSTHGR